MSAKKATSHPASPAQVAEQHAIIGNTTQPGGAGHTTHPDAQWFGQAGLGLFLHWGLASVHGQADLSWGMMWRDHVRREALDRYGPQSVQSCLTPEAYFALAERFQPDRYDPNRWLAAAANAGFRYAILTTRHHEGYALWPSAFGDFNTGRFLGGRDLVGEYVAACRRHGLRVGFYYSPPDWHFNRHRMSFNAGPGAPRGLRHEILAAMPDTAAASRDPLYHAHIRGQVEELLTRYGKIDLLWFDGEAPAGCLTLDWLRGFQPGLVVNRRGGCGGDFETPECHFPAARPVGWWEACHIWNDGAWGYLNHEVYKPTGWMLDLWSRVRAWGGNFLVNVGPNARGELPEPAYRRFDELAAWMRHSGASMLDTTPGPWPDRANVPVTCRPGVWYLHATYAHDGPLELRGVERPARVTLLGDGAPVPHVFDAGILRVEVPGDRRTVLDDVVAVTW